MKNTIEEVMESISNVIDNLSEIDYRANVSLGDEIENLEEIYESLSLLFNSLNQAQASARSAYSILDRIVK